MWLLHRVLGRPLGRFPMSLDSRTYLANLSWDILDQSWIDKLIYSYSFKIFYYIAITLC